MALYGSELSIDDSGLVLYGENVARLILKPGGRAAIINNLSVFKYV